MSDNQANPTKGAETDLQKAAKSISGLLSPETEVKPKEKDVKPITKKANKVKKTSKANKSLITI